MDDDIYEDLILATAAALAICAFLATALTALVAWTNTNRRAMRGATR